MPHQSANIFLLRPKTSSPYFFVPLNVTKQKTECHFITVTALLNYLSQFIQMGILHSLRNSMSAKCAYSNIFWMGHHIDSMTLKLTRYKDGGVNTSKKSGCLKRTIMLKYQHLHIFIFTEHYRKCKLNVRATNIQQPPQLFGMPTKTRKPFVLCSTEFRG